jgi:hypothetical protein
MLARQMGRILIAPNYDIVGGNLQTMTKQDGEMYKGPEWFVSGANDANYLGVYR